MITEVYIGKGDQENIWKTFIEHISKKYNIKEVPLEELKKYNIISLSTELFEVSVQKEKDMVGMIINPSTVSDYTPVILYIITDNDDIIQGILRNDQTVINSLYNKFLEIIDEEGDMELEIYSDENVESEFWAYVTLFDEMAFSMLKTSVFTVYESQLSNNTKVKLKDSKLLSIIKTGTFYPLMESLKLSISGKKSSDERGYL